MGAERPRVGRPATALDWIRLQVEGLYTYDAAGRMRFRDEPDGERAPRFFLGRTPAGNLWRFRDDLTPATVAELTALAERELAAEDLTQPALHLDGYREVLERDAPIERTYAGPAYRFPHEIAEPAQEIVALAEANSHLLQAEFPEWVDDAAVRPLIFGALHEGRVVSICASVAVTAKGHEVGVETLERARGRGFAPAVVAPWARAVRALGAEPIYGTNWENTASQAVTRKLGLVMFGEDFHLT